ncbi:hypothetical protein HK101_005514, partial [Irineochytrium annulatum]
MLTYAKTGELAVSTEAAIVLALGGQSLNINAEGNAIVISENAHDAIRNLIADLKANLSLLVTSPSGQSDGVGESFVDAAPPVDSLSYARILSYVEESIALAVQGFAIPQQLALKHDDKAGVEMVDISKMNELNQIRRVTVMFIQFPDLDVADIEDPETLDQFQRIFIILIKAIRSFGGCLRQFSCDDKAATALIVFGMHGYAHERGEGRAALNAATVILHRLRQVVLGSVSIAVTTGMVFAGVIGVDRRLDGTVLGVCVNLAARIMTHPISSGRIVCDDETRKSFEAEESDFKFEAYDEIELKGVGKSLTLYVVYKRLSGNTGLKGVTPVLCGREPEREAFRGLVQKWERGEGDCFLMISGISGSGKTSLWSFCRELLEQNPKNLICTAAGNEVLQGTPYFGYVQILQQLVNCLKLRAVGLNGLGAKLSSLREVNGGVRSSALLGTWRPTLATPDSVGSSKLASMDSVARKDSHCRKDSVSAKIESVSARNDGVIMRESISARKNSVVRKDSVAGKHSVNGKDSSRKVSLADVSPAADKDVARKLSQ